MAMRTPSLALRSCQGTAKQLSDGEKTYDWPSDVRFWTIEDVERFERYGLGGYHSVAIDDRLGNCYRILGKLGHGSYSTVWLARDEKTQRLVAVKVCTADASEKESEILSLLGDLPEVGDKDGGDALGRGMIPKLLDKFIIEGLRGNHTCLVTDPAGCSLNQAKTRCHYKPLNLPVARSFAAQLVIAVAYLHSKGIVHGDLHLGNVLFRLPEESSLWSDEEVSEEFWKFEPEPVETEGNTPIPPGVPLVATRPLEFDMERTDKLQLSDSHIVLADFGESYRPSLDSRLKCRTLTHCSPPEGRFEPTEPESFPSDIWTLACALWDVLTQRPLFGSSWPFDAANETTRLQVQALGKLPDQWWEKWDARSKWFTEEGEPIQVGDDPVRTLDHHFESSMNRERRRYKMRTMVSAEKKALFAMLRSMLAYRPEQRCNIEEVLASK
ncbi:hypothetical protein CMUS01_07538 [Colletotrichum musicola]|uniref:Protein kinase domain-containing protein n=1 Tax=Colletotrichum musicola TaxID=2175873 RepID=A0A8H6NEZ3_9PEZI|nr:hypothetical protein CMUS01_07538 [Colletotrichum musicola]